MAAPGAAFGVLRALVVTNTIGGSFYPSVHAAVDQFPRTQAGAPRPAARL